jgi:hypothetical protein
VTIAFLDQATRLTGWCVGGGDKLPAVGVWPFPQLPQGAHGKLGAFMHNSLSTLVETRGVTILGFETPIHRPIDNRDKLRRLFGLPFYIETFCELREQQGLSPVRCVEVDLRNVKKELTGLSTAEKKDMVAAAEKVGIDLPVGPGREDAADAFGGWLVLVRLYAKEHSNRWDQALWGRRGLI